MIDPNSFDGGLRFGPKTFAEETGRNRVWAKPRELLCGLIRVACPTCGCARRRALFGSDPAYVCCEVCGMIYTAMEPTEKALLDYYRNGPAPTSWAEHVQQHPLELFVDRLKFRWALELAGWGAPNDVLLDVGCSTGTLLSVATDMATDVHYVFGVEPNEAAAEVARRATPGIAVYDWLERYALQQPPNPMPNLIVFWEVLEHVIDPAKLLLDAAKLMRSGPATILICVPNAFSLAAKVLHEKAPMFGVGHFNIWSPSTLQMFLQRYLPEFTVEYRSIISWTAELTNHYLFKGPFDTDVKTVVWDPAVILKNLEGYKLVAVARRA